MVDVNIFGRFDLVVEEGVRALNEKDEMVDDDEVLDGISEASIGERKRRDFIYFG